MPSRKGKPNKMGAIAKENIICVFTRIGGVEAMVTWAKGNQTDFYKLYAKLIPTQIEATVNNQDVRELSDDELAAIIASAGSERATESKTGKKITGSLH